MKRSPSTLSLIEPMESRTMMSAGPVSVPTEASLTVQSGDGLVGQYFNDSTLTTPALSRVDPQINFNWRYGGPDSALGVDRFSARWTGFVQAENTETYTFYTRTDDGVRLWVDGKLLVDRWRLQRATEFSGSISLEAGKKYSIRMEYYENNGRAVAELRWSSPSTLKQIIPQWALFTSNDGSGGNTGGGTGGTGTGGTGTGGTGKTGSGGPATPTPTAPNAPGSLVASPLGTSSIQLNWADNSTNESGFVVEQSADGSSFSPIGTTLADVTGFLGAGLQAGTRYFYRVEAINAVGTSAYTAVVSVVTNAIVPNPSTYSSPLVITKGGTYTGAWESKDPNVAAVSVQTSEPVTIVNSLVRGPGNLIEASNGANVTIRNVTGYGLNPNISGKMKGRFLNVEGFKSVRVENCTLEATTGIYLYDYQGDGSVAQSVKILNNKAHNIDGRKSDGNGGYQAVDNDADYVQFFQINGVKNLVGAEIAWNQVINEAGLSRVEDNISIHNSSGTNASPLLIHNNYIQGAYPVNAATDGYSGGGIMVSDNGSSWVRAYDNQVISTSNYGIAISSGHDNSFYNNRIISSGKLSNGQAIASQNVGAYIWNQNGEATFANNEGHGNVIGWLNGGSANNAWTPDASSWKNNTDLGGAITTATEQAEYQLWVHKLSGSAISVGSTMK